MLRSLAVLALTGLLAGCGLAETGAAAAAGGVSKAEEARQAKQTEARIQQQIDQLKGWTVRRARAEGEVGPNVAARFRRPASPKFINPS